MDSRLIYASSDLDWRMRCHLFSYFLSPFFPQRTLLTYREHGLSTDCGSSPSLKVGFAYWVDVNGSEFEFDFGQLEVSFWKRKQLG